MSHVQTYQHGEDCPTEIKLNMLHHQTASLSFPILDHILKSHHLPASTPSAPKLPRVEPFQLPRRVGQTILKTCETPKDATAMAFLPFLVDSLNSMSSLSFSGTHDPARLSTLQWLFQLLILYTISHIQPKTSPPHEEVPGTPYCPSELPTEREPAHDAPRSEIASTSLEPSDLLGATIPQNHVPIRPKPGQWLDPLPNCGVDFVDCGRRLPSRKEELIRITQKEVTTRGQTPQENPSPIDTEHDEAVSEADSVEDTNEGVTLEETVPDVEVHAPSPTPASPAQKTPGTRCRKFVTFEDLTKFHGHHGPMTIGKLRINMIVVKEKRNLLQMMAGGKCHFSPRAIGNPDHANPGSGFPRSPSKRARTRSESRFSLKSALKEILDDAAKYAAEDHCDICNRYLLVCDHPDVEFGDHRCPQKENKVIAEDKLDIDKYIHFLNCMDREFEMDCRLSNANRALAEGKHPDEAIDEWERLKNLDKPLSQPRYISIPG
ncbi:hypothetical protein K402DRAFT_134674 [Aulographum hederae CBS 113979]|uniref:Uncharacterized protein n=1 Tax=Aulographum hederae CBS 113979 TaxID=1176131 RepID=A0A6G1GUV8_9PEZI|nr:hypothetical protein K402DRAFT_134674 [Aulographum hederae CBS 113979]